MPYLNPPRQPCGPAALHVCRLRLSSLRSRTWSARSVGHRAQHRGSAYDATYARKLTVTESRRPAPLTLTVALRESHHYHLHFFHLLIFVVLISRGTQLTGIRALPGAVQLCSSRQDPTDSCPLCITPLFAAVVLSGHVTSYSPPGLCVWTLCVWTV